MTRQRSGWSPLHVSAALLIILAAIVGLYTVATLPDRPQPGEPGPRRIAADPSATASGIAIEPPAATDPPEATQPPAATPPPAATRQPAAATQHPATDAPATRWTEGEEDLHYSLREDALHDCLPRRTNLPVGAVAGIECRPTDDPWPDGWEDAPYGVAERVGVYGFESEEGAAIAYLDRMTDADVTLRQGDCWNGTSGDLSWVPGDGDAGSEPAVEYRGELFNPGRFGCFLDENGTANVRLTCGGGIYIGVLGRNADLATLYRWTAVDPPYREVATPSPPGICYGTDGLIFPDTEP